MMGMYTELVCAFELTEETPTSKKNIEFKKGARSPQLRSYIRTPS